MPSPKEDLKEVPTCHLYTLDPSQRIANELIALDIDPKGVSPLDVLVLNQLDGMRYEGDRGTDIFRAHLDTTFGQSTAVTVLDVGSGFGGPSRLLALKRPNTTVVALEYVPEISTMAKALTSRCQVFDCVTHVTVDISKSKCTALGGRCFHAAQAVLSLLHVPDMDAALTNIYGQLRPDGFLYIEDFCNDTRGTLSEQAKHHLASRVGCPRSPMTASEWEHALRRVGFQQVDFQNVTAAWRPWIHGRASEYESDMDRHIRVQGHEGAKHMLEFYQTMDYLFATELGGCRIVARKLKNDPAS